MNTKKYPWLEFGSFLLPRIFSISVILLMLLMSLSNSRARAEDTIDIFVGPGDQGWYGRVAAFDSINNRFLAVWTDGGVETLEIDLFGQLVNADGTLYGSPIAIATLSGSQQVDPQARFDPINGRFLVVWGDNRNWFWNIYGQLVNADGSLYGGDFPISPVSHWAGSPAIQFETTNNRFLVVWSGPSAGTPVNIYGQLVNPNGSLHGSMIQVTNYVDYYAAYPDIAFDLNNGRFLVTWGNQSDGGIYGRLLNVDGTLYGSEIAVGYYSGVYNASSSFDPINGRFLQLWGIKGQLINADGTLYGTEITMFNPGTHLVGNPAVVFDTASDKFLVAADIQYPYLGIVGQLLNPDGSLYGPDFRIFEVIYDGREGNMGGYPPSIASGSTETGALVVYMDIPYSSTSRYDIFGTFVKIPDATPPTTTASPPGGSYSSGQTVTLTCNDGSGSGCDKVYYTTDGNTPSTSSPVYSSPINISVTTILKFFATDLAGNAESVKTESYTISTNVVTVELRDSIGNPLSGGVVQYYSGGWQPFGTTDASGRAMKELMPGSYTFSMNYAFARQEKAQNIGTNPTVVFQTTNVTVQLKNSTGTLMDTGTVQYYSGGWRDIGSTSGGQVTKELLPGSYTFRMNYAFARQEKAQNIGTNPTVVFQTTNVVVQLKDSTGALMDAGTVQYYSGGWRNIGSTSGGQVSRELLTGIYTFSMNYAFARQEKAQNIGTNPTVVFQTTNVVVQLKDSTGALMDTGTVQYYSAGWRDIGATSAGQISRELLPGSYTFSMNYAYARKEKVQNIAADPTVVFQTGQVHSDSGTCTQYYAGGWRSFTQDFELLPLTYTFRFNDGTPDSPYAIIVGTVNYIH